MHLFGNYLALHCEGVTVAMAHLQGGSVTVANGDRVKVGQLLGRVGNTGQTSEPHLHMHAVRGRVVDPEVLGATGEPVPMVFGPDRAYLVRHDLVQTADPDRD
jgi:murein DD-endopeptidase MepM/ murein hydrolase activator NlpD